MRKILCAFFAALLLWSLAGCALGELFAASCTVAFQQTEARAMLEMVNDFRIGDEAWYWNSDNETKTWAEGLGPLVYDYTLEKIAMQRAAEIALSFSHTRPDDSRCFSAYTDYGWTLITAGENIAAGYSTAAVTFLQWKEDDKNYSGQGHRRNLLNNAFKYIGIGHCVFNGRHYWAQALANGYHPDTVYVTANDQATEVVIRISDAQISSLSVDSIDPAVLTVEYEGQSVLPAANLNLKLTSAWPSNLTSRVTVTPAWESADASCAAVSDGIVIGKAVGETALTAAFQGLDCSVPVTVSCARLLTANFVLPQSVDTIGSDAFREIAAVAVLIPDGAAVIGENAFADCKALRQITIPPSVTQIAATAFDGCGADLVICCKAGSAAETFARTQGIDLILMQQSP